MKIVKRETFSFDDVLLVPQFSDIKSRSEINLEVQIPRIDQSLRIPVISSPMDTVTESDMATLMSNAGGLGIIHRYNTIAQQSQQVYETAKSNPGSVVAAAVGITGTYLDRCESAIESGTRILCIDVAHGHHILVEKSVKRIRERFGDSIHIMAGNVATLEAFNALSDWGVDSIRVGIGGGSICSTRTQTGHGLPTLQSVIDCSVSDRPALLIADGGIRSSGDMVKSLAAGADLVMVGSLLAGSDEAPGHVLRGPGGKQYKMYRGMASSEAQIQWRGKVSSLEGVSTLIEAKGDATQIINNLERGIRSGLSYSGARTVGELQCKSEFVYQTAPGAIESTAHINRVN